MEFKQLCVCLVSVPSPEFFPDKNSTADSQLLGATNHRKRDFNFLFQTGNKIPRAAQN